MEDKALVLFKETDEQGNEVYGKSTTYSAEIQKFKDNPETLPDTLTTEHLTAIENVFTTDIQQFVKDARKTKPKKKIRIKDQYFEDFKALWHKINQNSLYFIDNLNPENEQKLVAAIVAEINKLEINKIFLRRKKSVIDANKLGTDNGIITEDEEATIYECKIDYLQLIHRLATNTKTPLSFIVKIVNALSPDFKRNMLKNDVSQAQKEMATIIRKKLLGDIKAHIKYVGVDGKISNTGVMYDKNGNFIQELSPGSLGKTQEEISQDFNMKEQWIFEDVIEYDSDFEKQIILKDDKNAQIKIFGKMPKLEINTPLGKYSPDFCYAIENTNGAKVILIVESKGYNTEQDIPEEENDKIEFAEKFFSKVNEKHKDAGINIVYKKRINKTQLISLINAAIQI
jgi:type III restriction enzyme